MRDPGKGDLVGLVALDQTIEANRFRPKLNLVIGLLKGRDLEEPVEGLCQLAVHGIHIVTTDHTQEFKGQDHGKLVERLRAKSLVALKQAKKPWLTSIHVPIPLRECKSNLQSMPLIVLEAGEDRLPQTLSEPFALVSGPQGGFSMGELA